MQFPMVIDGQRVESLSGERYEDRDPASDQVLALLPRANPADVDRAVEAATRAFNSKEWGGIAPAERGRLMLRLAQLIRANAEELARLESQDNGKPLRQARNDAQVAARYFEFYAGVADKIMGNTIPIGPGFLDYTIREPLGVSGHIVPWNYPIQITSRGVAPAVAAGNTCVVKPSSEAPLTAVRLGELAIDAGFPAGVINVVTGRGSEVGDYLVTHPGINQITFTGSVSTGQRVMELAARHVIPVQMELGGKSPNVVFADADLDLTVPAVANAIFQNAGQTCSAGSRLLVERRAHDEVVDRLRQRAQQMRLGPGIEDPDMGPMISRGQLQRVLEYIEIGKREGARVAVGGAQPDDPQLRRGYFIQPTVLDQARNEMRVAQDEIFGPVLTVIEFDDLEEAARIANQSEFGLVAGVWTRDINKALYLASRIKAGQVFVNTYGAGGGVELPFGGYKKSGFGREKGLEALAAYTQVKNVCVKFA
ncbi:MAG: aldehyde dehydrogenase family protein [Chloroflexi bacterium]|nr:aldehyde dehydrogenase family protein [Chloroflexota bacterium]